MNKIAANNIALCSLALALTTPSLVMAGNLEPTAAPSDPASAVYKTDDVYNRLQSGTAGAKRTGGFAEPSAGPADGVGKTLDEIMTVTPAADNVNGATQADVKSGKTFWGLRTDGTWGPKTGSGEIGGSAYPALVPRTGQTTCYNDMLESIPCTGTGQDGDTHKGVTIPTPRFTDNSNGTVTDNLTGLVWLKNGNCMETVGNVTPGTSGRMTWVDALTWSNNLASGKCGLADGSAVGEWRLPNKKELLSLTNDAYTSPSLSNRAGTAKWVEGDPFTFNGFQNSTFWSSTTNPAAYPAAAWCINFVNGSINGIPKTSTSSGWVWPVRGGQ